MYYYVHQSQMHTLRVHLQEDCPLVLRKILSFGQFLQNSKWVIVKKLELTIWHVVSAYVRMASI